jgi:putative oxidoreductase
MLNRYSTDWGLLIIRVSIGALFIYFGYLKVIGGTEMWAGVGSAMKTIHVNFGYTFWGLMATIAECVGGLCLILGFLFRPALAMMIFTMFIAVWSMHSGGKGLGDFAFPLLCGLVFIGLFFSGPGSYALKITKR